MKVLHSIFQPIWKTQQWPQYWKRSVFIPIPKKGNTKEHWNFCIITLISHASKVMLKILQVRLGEIGKARAPEKHLLLLYWLCQSLWLCGSQQAVENSERDGNTRPPDLPLEKSVCRSGSPIRTGHGTTDWF